MNAAGAKLGSENAVRKTRNRALIVPREHGAWGLLFIPLITGIVASLGASRHVWPVFFFLIASFSLFWLRTPVESLLGVAVISARTPEEKRVACTASVILGVISVLCLTALVWGGRNLKLLPIGAIVAMSFVIQFVLRSMGRKLRMASQLVGAIGLTATAAAAYYLSTGNLDSRALALWVSNWLFACNQIHYVQIRIHFSRLTGFREKLAKAKVFFSTQVILLLTLLLAASRHWTPALVVVAFIPAVARGTKWFFEASKPLEVRKLGWAEMKQGAVFALLLSCSFLYAF